MDTPVPPELHRAGLLERFPEPTETAYRRWALVRSWSSVRVILWISVFVWVSNPLFQPYVLNVEGAFPLKIYLAAWGVGLPLVLASAVLPTRHIRGWMPPVVLALTTFTGLTCISWSGAENTPTLLVATTVLFLFLAPVLQFPIRSTAVVLVLLVPVTVVVAALAARREGSWSNTLSYELWLLAAASTYALAIALVIERSSRGRFVDERVIIRQHDELVASRALIRRYVPPTVADRIEHGDTTVDSAQRRRVTIFFADVVGFTTLADRLDPEALAEIVNEYLGSVAEIVERHGGTLNEFAGDGVMAIFGAPDELDPRDQVASPWRPRRSCSGHCRRGASGGTRSASTRPCKRGSASTPASCRSARSGPRSERPTPGSGCRRTSPPVSRPSASPDQCCCPRPAGTCSPTRSAASRAVRSR